jgi:acyl-CoA thioester hydrolase
MLLHILHEGRKVGPFPPEILEAIAVMKSAHAALPRPDHIGRVIAIPNTGRVGKVGLH